MNAADPLDVMLDQSSPGTVTITPSVQRDLEVTNRAAAREVVALTPSRWTARLVVGFGLALALPALPQPPVFSRGCPGLRILTWPTRLCMSAVRGVAVSDAQVQCAVVAP